MHLLVRALQHRKTNRDTDSWLRCSGPWWPQNLYIHQDTNLCKNYNWYGILSDTVGPKLNNVACKPYNMHQTHKMNDKSHCSRQCGTMVSQPPVLPKTTVFFYPKCFPGNDYRTSEKTLINFQIIVKYHVYANRTKV